MNSALIELLEEKEFSQITVVDVCKKANVNRSTFYSHYNNTYLRKYIRVRKLEYVLPENYLCYEHPYHLKESENVDLSRFQTFLFCPKTPNGPYLVLISKISEDREALIFKVSRSFCC